jgi:uncharacterized protein with von Willebrand factor type A (vWA) domain
MPVDEQVLIFIDRLREAGIGVSLAETIDAFLALQTVPLDRMLIFRSSLRSTLVKSEQDFNIFERLFDEFFTGTEALAGRPEVPLEEQGESQAPPTPEDIADMVAAALMSGTADDVAAMARMAAGAVGSMEGGFGGGGRPMPMLAGAGYYLFKGMEMVELARMTVELEAMAADGQLGSDVPPMLALEQLRERIALFRRELEREIRRLIAIERGPDALPRRQKLPPRPEEVDFMHASLSQVEDMRRILPGLSRKLAARIARRNSVGKRGRVDIRSTLRHSISTGGVPLDLKYRKRIPYRPEIWILCDVSGSVRTFSTFTLQLVYSLHQQFRAVRSFAFIDKVDEVTGCFADLDVEEAVGRVYREADVVDGDGHSDIGRALDMFNREYSRGLGARSTVLILSDGRNNARDPRPDALEQIGRMARKVYWLNPESRFRWDTGDSVMASYEEHCDSAHECRNLRQLADFVYRRT